MEALLTERFQLGECPRWDDQRKALWWVDILQHQLHYLVIATGEHQVRQFSEEVGCFTLCQSGGLIIAGQSGFWSLTDLQSEITFIGDPELHLPAQRFNDGRCDSAGRFIAGTVNPSKDESFGQFYQLDNDLKITPLVGRSWTCNGLAFSPDNKTLYWSDTPGRKIYQCDYAPEKGQVTNQRLFYQVDESQGRPDGASVDQKGNYWSALYGGSEVICISPDGELLQRLPVPVTNPTMVCFGGDELKTMFITSASQKMTAEQLEKNPLEGALLSYQAPFSGLSEYAFITQ